MGIQIYPTVPVAQPEAEPWPIDEHTIRIDEMFARQLDTEFSSGVRALLHDPETGISARRGEAALEAIAGALPALHELKERTLSQAMGSRQRGILEPPIETRLDWAAGTLGRFAERATIEVDDASVADRIAGLKQDASFLWRDPAYLQKLGRTTVEELRYQGERRGWGPAEIDTKARSSLSDLYAGAVEAAIGQDDLAGAAGLYDHARPIIDPERQATLDRRFVRAREVAVYRDIDRDMEGIPIEPAGPPGAEVFESRAVELTPDDATDEMRARIAQVAAHAHRHAERRWSRRQAEAGVAALDWVGKNPGRSFLASPPEIRDWLAPDQWRGLEALLIEGRPRTDRDLFERLDRQMVYEPARFAALDLDRYRLSLDDEDHARFVGGQKAIVEGRVDPGHVRHDWLRRGIDRALKVLGIDTEGPEAADARADARDQLDGFEAIEGRAPNGQDIDAIVGDVVGRIASDDAAAEGPSLAVGDGFDPRHIVPAQAGGRPPPFRPPAPPPPRPQPGPGHNQPPAQLPGTTPGRPSPLAPQPLQGTQPAPGVAGPAAAAEQDAARERVATYDIYREHLKELDPANPLLKLEPVPGVPPDKVIVESIQKEVGALIQGKLGRFVFKNYDNYPNGRELNGEQGNGDDVRILRGDKAKAEADFAELSKHAQPHAVFSGQHAESQTVLKLPGEDMYVGFRISKDGLPTIDINSPHTGSIRFHYK